MTSNRLSGKLVILRLFRLGRLPPAQNSAEILAEHGYPVLAIEYGNLRESPTFVPGTVPRLRLGCPWAVVVPPKLRMVFVMASALVRLLSLMLFSRPALIVAEGINEQFLAWIICRLLRIPYAVHVHEAYEPGRMQGPINNALLRMEGPALRGARFLIFPEQTRAQIYRERYALSCPILLAFNCPRLREKREKVDLRPPLELPPDALLMLYVGGIGRLNALPLTFAAMRGIPTLYFLLAGWCDPEDRRQLESHARECGVTERVRFLGELTDDKWEYLDNCDISYCIYEPTELRLKHAATASNKLMESLAAGLPVICSDNPDFEAFVGRFDVGVTVPLTVDGISAGLSRLVNDELGRRRQGRHGIEWHRRQFHYERQFFPVMAEIRRYVTPLWETPFQARGPASQ